MISSWIDRANLELKDLQEKITKLEVYLKSKEVKVLSKADRHLLTIQFSAMVTYSTTLQARLDLTNGN